MHQDSQIVNMLLARDEQALQMIREKYGALCTQIAYRMTGSREDAEECVSDLLLEVWNSVPPQHPENLRAYVTAITGKIAIKKYEHAHRLKRGGTQLAKALDELAEILPSDTHVEQEIEQRELTAALTAWLRTLPAGQRRIFVRRYYLSESVQEIAESSQMRVSAVKMTLLRARNKLKEYLQKEGLL
ncbi:MAG: sigma-70 family RNA polymerase sigma factor [Oscillospiraceae bacterium]|nr:sigma-70 family RNA polymerase sigma factor [Oscillospiraceae bacterium]MBQ5337796.1 sigma-70 family RNA polymerase sigma factor [Oscillospiraceae bacterium]